MKSLTVKIIGLGGAGIAVMEHIAPLALEGVSLAVLDTSGRTLGASRCAEQRLLGSRLLRGNGSGGDPDLGKVATEEELFNCQTLFQGVDLLILLGGLGGGTATGAMPVLARAAREAGTLVLALVSLPFEFEGPRRLRQAGAGLKSIKAAADAVLCLPNQKLSRLFDESTRALEVFEAANRFWADGVAAVVNMISRRGLIEVDFADVSAVLRGRNAESCFATVTTRGETRGSELIEKIQSHPLLDEGRAVTGADAVLIALSGGPDMTIAEVNRITDALRRQPEHAQCVVAARIDESLAGRLEVTVIAVKHGNEEPVDPATTASQLPTEAHFLESVPSHRPPPSYVPPVPELTPDRAHEVVSRQSGRSGRSRKASAKMKQIPLPLDLVAKGRFEKSEPTIHQGEDLDVPTYIRRGIKLN